MGILNHHVDYKQAQLIKVHAEMPGSSRPLYEVLATGVPSYRNGILTNADGQHSKNSRFLILSKLPAEVLQLQHIIGKVNYSIKHLMKSNEIVFNMTTKSINMESFISENQYPDSHVFADGHYLLQTYQICY